MPFDAEEEISGGDQKENKLAWYRDHEVQWAKQDDIVQSFSQEMQAVNTQTAKDEALAIRENQERQRMATFMERARTTYMQAVCSQEAGSLNSDKHQLSRMEEKISHFQQTLDHLQTVLTKDSTLSSKFRVQNGIVPQLFEYSVSICWECSLMLLSRGIQLGQRRGEQSIWHCGQQRLQFLRDRSPDCRL